MAVRRTTRLYLECQIPRSAAALSYYLTMTVFPMLIFLYALFGQSYGAAMSALNTFRTFLSQRAVELMQEYLKHIASSNNDGILLAAAMAMLMPASAAIRLLESTIGDMQGGRRFRVAIDIPLSIAMSIAFVLTMYFAIAVMLTGRTLVTRVVRSFPGLRVHLWWTGIRFVLLAGAVFLILWGVFVFSKRRQDRYRTWPGALLATAFIVVVSYVFSVFISASANYSLVYGSLASMILLMFWLFLICQMILIGAAFNIALWKHT